MPAAGPPRCLGGVTLTGMRCPFCPASDTRVVDSRAADGGSSVRRRRLCTACERRFTTYERASIVPLVRKRDGRLEPFDAEKLRRGVARALADRPIPAKAVTRLVEDIEQNMARDVVSADEIGHAVLARLRELDEVAYLRYASVYKDFTGAEDFEREMAELEGNP